MKKQTISKLTNFKFWMLLKRKNNVSQGADRLTAETAPFLFTGLNHRHKRKASSPSFQNQKKGLTLIDNWWHKVMVLIMNY